MAAESLKGELRATWWSGNRLEASRVGGGGSWASLESNCLVGGELGRRSELSGGGK